MPPGGLKINGEHPYFEGGGTLLAETYLKVGLPYMGVKNGANACFLRKMILAWSLLDPCFFLT
jgi:hypothetical protein